MRLEAVLDTAQVQSPVTLLLLRLCIASLQIESKANAISFRSACDTPKLQQFNWNSLKCVCLASSLSFGTELATLEGIVLLDDVRLEATGIRQSQRSGPSEVEASA